MKVSSVELAEFELFDVHFLFITSAHIRSRSETWCFTKRMLIMWVWIFGKHCSVDTKYDIIGSPTFGFMTSKSTHDWCAVTQNHKFTSEGFAICTTYSALYPQTFDSDKEKLHQRQPFNKLYKSLSIVQKSKTLCPDNSLLNMRSRRFVAANKETFIPSFYLKK